MAMQSFPRPEDRAKRKRFERGEKTEALMPCLSSTQLPMTSLSTSSFSALPATVRPSQPEPVHSLIHS